MKDMIACVDVSAWKIADANTDMLNFIAYPGNKEKQIATNWT